MFTLEDYQTNLDVFRLFAKPVTVAVNMDGSLASHAYPRFLGVRPTRGPPG